MPRTQSPSSINIFKQCPRKYYYAYIEKIPTLPSIHTLRGNIVHEVVESFFLLNPENLNGSDFKTNFMILITDMLKKKWEDSKKEFEKLNLTKDQLDFFYEESNIMVQMWVHDLIKKITKHMEKGMSFQEAFKKVKPIATEEFFESKKWNVLGYIDAIFDNDGEVSILDYKTSKKAEITQEYQLQLAIYALLYAEKYGKMPKKVGIHFFKYGDKWLDVSKELLEKAQKECEKIQELTKSNDINNYNRNPSALCKWSNGKCDFYDICFGRDKDK